jgi:hypothetical protein
MTNEDKNSKKGLAAAERKVRYIKNSFCTRRYYCKRTCNQNQEYRGTDKT